MSCLRDGLLVVAAFICVAALGVGVASAEDVLFLRNSAHAGAPSDTAWVDRIENVLGYSVLEVEHGVDATAAAAAADLVIISSTCSSGSAITSLGGAAAARALTTPIMAWEDATWDELGIREGPQATSGATTITIVEDTHPLAAGLPAGDVAVYTTGGDIRHGTGANSGGLWVATITSWQSNLESPIIILEPGDALEGGGTAPARRLGFFLADHAFPIITTEGLALFDAAVNYTIPEPATVTLLGLGSLALIRRRRR